jgi:hypothetical protein
MSAEGTTAGAAPTGDLPAWATAFAPLEREMIAYRRELPRLLEAGEEGRYALLKGDTLLGVWDTQADALSAGRERFGLEAVCVKRVDARDVLRLARLEAEVPATGAACRS